MKHSLLFGLLFSLLSTVTFSQNILWEKESDSMQFKQIIELNDGRRLVLSTRTETVKHDPPIIRGDVTIRTSYLHGFSVCELAADFELDCKIESNCSKNVSAIKVLPVGDSGFLFLKGVRIDSTTSKRNLIGTRYDEGFSKIWERPLNSSSNFAQYHFKDAISHDDESLTFLYDRADTVSIIHLDKQGKEIWRKTIEDSLLHVSRLQLLTNGDIMVLGGKELPDDDCIADNDYWIMRLTANGEEKWTKKYLGIGSSKAYKAIESKNDELFILGTTKSIEGNRKYRGSYFGTGGSLEASIFKLNKKGSLQWHKSYGGFATESFQHIIELPDGRINCIGATNSIDGDVFFNNGGHDVWVVQLNAAGELIWEETYGGTVDEYPRLVTSTADNSIEMLCSKTQDGTQILWQFAIDDSYDVSKPETHGEERRNRKPIQLEYIKTGEDVDRFLMENFPGEAYRREQVEVPISIGEKIKDLEEAQWFIEDFDGDGKLELVVSGTKKNSPPVFYHARQDESGSFVGEYITRFDYPFELCPVLSTSEKTPTLVLTYCLTETDSIEKIQEQVEEIKEESNNSEDTLTVVSFRDISAFNAYPAPTKSDTLIYRHGGFIYLNNSPIAQSEIISIESSNDRIKIIVHKDGTIEASESSWRLPEGRREFNGTVDQESHNQLFGTAAEWNPDQWPNPAILSMSFHTSPTKIKVVLQNGETFETTNYPPFRSVTVQRINNLLMAECDKLINKEKE